MGANFISLCHKCKEMCFHFRYYKDVGRSLPAFYKDHYKCGKQDYKNVETFWDYTHEPEAWVDELYKNTSDKYRTVKEEV